MIKFLLGITMVAFTTFCGYLLSKKYRKRMLFFQELQVFNERFLSEIAYARRPIKDFVSKYTFYGEFSNLLADFFACIDDGAPFCGDDLQGYTFLKEDEKRFLEEYFRMLGRGDSASQNAYFSSVKATLSSYKNTAETDGKKYGDLYIKIGFLCGLLILILIV